MTAVLVAENDRLVAAPLSEALRAEGYDVSLVEDGPSALASARTRTTSLVLLDARLPDGSGGTGLEVCRALRSQAADLPVIMVSEHRSGVVPSLDAGADDFLTLPLREDEVMARIRALLRRSRPEPFEVNHVRLDPAARKAWLDDDEVLLTTKEFDLLRVLIREAGTVVTRQQLMEEVWERVTWDSSKTLDMHVSWLRRKLGDSAAKPRFITTLRGVGFRFEPGSD